MNSAATPVSRWRSRNRSRTLAAVVASSAEVGSSNRMSSGSQAKASAMTARWFSPPDTSCGYFLAVSDGSGRPTIASRRSVSPAASAGATAR